MKKKLIIGIISVLLILTGVGYGVGSFFVHYALSPVSDSAKRNINEEDKIDTAKGTEKVILQNQKKEQKKATEFKKTTSNANITNNDNLKLQANYKVQEKKTHKWAILIHGYKVNNNNMMSYGEKYYEMGYNVLLPNNRAHGNSEGNYIGMGWLDKDDIACWVNWINKQDPNAKIILHGVSMGAATTMMASGENLNNVVGYIED